MRLYFAREARRELREAALYYLERSELLHRQFVDDVAKALRLIQAYPEAWPLARRDSRKCLLSRFPFGLVYRQREKAVRIIAVAHAKRRPNYWSRRK